MKRITRAMIVVAAVWTFTGCAGITPPQPPSLELPKPPIDLRAVRKGDKVILSWSIPTLTTDRQAVRKLGPTRICRSEEPQLTECGTPVGEVAPAAVPRWVKQKVPASYTDALPTQLLGDEVSRGVTYAVAVANGDGRDAGLSNRVWVPTIKTVPAPQDFAARVTSQGVVLTWTGAAEGSTGLVRHVYRVYRRQEGSPQASPVGEVPSGDGQLRLIDSNIEWEKTYEYRVESVTIAARTTQASLQLEGDDSPEVKVFAHDVFPPAVPGGVQAVFSGPGQQTFVDLIWAPVTDLDLDGYNVYRREEGAEAVKVNAQLVKTPAYRDASVVAGKNYSYSVSAVDVRGNESARSEEASERVP